MKIAIIGGGAAGFFAAITAKEYHPSAHVVIFEKTKKLLSKVKISGGGRCNVTNHTTSIKELSNSYPRGGKALKKILTEFNPSHTMQWFESRGVPLMVQDNNYVFPASQSSQSIIDCFINETERLKIDVETGIGVKAIRPVDSHFRLEFLRDEHPDQVFDKVIVATGGSPKKSGLTWLEDLGHQIEDPVPSLFTFNLPNDSITKLMGVVASDTIVSIQGTKLKSSGPLLITHWGMSGPAVLRLSAFGARILSDMDYKFTVQVNWINVIRHDDVRSELKKIINAHPKKRLSSIKPFDLPIRLWEYLIQKIDLSTDKIWGELGKNGINKFIHVLTNDVYHAKGKTTFKEEFVTCGGVSLESVHMKTMESVIVPNLYFTGEVLDIDGITGGFNFQAAWTTAFIAGQLRKNS